MRSVFKTHYLLFVALLVVTSCDGLNSVKPKDFYNPKNFFNTENEVESAVNGIYASVYQNDGGRWMQNGAFATDNQYSPPYVPFQRQHALDEYTFNAGNQDIGELWTAFYKAVNRANLVTNNISDADIDPERRDSFLGEARFMRAWHYFMLVKNFGGVPLILNDNLGERDINVESATPEEVYSQIIEDLEAAEEGIKNDRPEGHATAGTASSYLAKVYLRLASEQKNNVFPDRSYNRSAQEYYSLAADKAKQVIDSGQYGLFDDFQDNFNVDTENGKEHIFSTQFSRAQQAHVLNLIGFPQECGLLPITPFAEFIPTLDVFQAYQESDYRREVTFLTECTSDEGEELTFEDFSAPVPHNAKWFNPNYSDVLRNRDLNIPRMRYSEVLLIYAEALNELGRTDEAYEFINMVRERARNGDPTSEPQDIPSGSLSQDEFREAVFKERRLEFAFEGIRRDDMVRSGRLTEILCSGGPNVNGCENVQDFHVVFPIPARELNLNPELEQNRGYN